MTIENWLTIAVIISTLIAPTLANLIQSRAEHHTKPTPEANQPKNLSQRIWRWFIRLSNSPWILPPFLMLINIYALLSDFRKTTPVTRLTVYQISSYVAGIWYACTIFLLNIAWRSIRDQWEVNHQQSDLNVTFAKTDLGLLDLIKVVSDTSHEAFTKSL